MKELIGLLTLSSLGGLWFFLLTFSIALGIGATVFWIWILIEILTRETDENNTRLIWTLVVIFTHWLGALIYLFARRSERINKLGR